MIKYGIPGHYINVTELVVKLCDRSDRYIEIPKTEDGRSSLFGDPIWGSLKHILMNGIEIPAGQECYIPIKILYPHTGNFEKILKNDVDRTSTDTNFSKILYPHTGNFEKISENDVDRTSTDANFSKILYPHTGNFEKISENDVDRTSTDNNFSKILYPHTGNFEEILKNDVDRKPTDANFSKILYPHTGNFEEILKNDVDRKPTDANFSKILYPYIGNPHEKLKKLHSTLKFTGGKMTDEYPEQVMAVSFINPDDRVLEIGSNIGRNSLVISSILSDSSNLSTIESDPANIPTLIKNRDDNNFHFKIYNGALSRSNLWQRWWVTKPQEICPGPDWTRVNTFMLSDVNNNPTVLVADCEGALYYIFRDFPEILNTVKTILVENDYRDAQHYLAVETIFKENGFDLYYNDYCHEAKQYNLPLYKNFFQVWKR